MSDNIKKSNHFDEYLKQGEPNKSEKAKVWKTAIGLQEVDGLKPSSYLIDTARQNIEGEISLPEVQDRLDDYYKQLHKRQDSAKSNVNQDSAHQNTANQSHERTEEADKVSARIVEILNEQTFNFSPVEYLSIHQRLFFGIDKHAGKYRQYNISKAEWVLDGESVMYASFNSLRETLEYDFEQEKKFSYKGLSQTQIIEHIAQFISYLWQIHVFGEGNTRTTAIFLIKYLRKLGFKEVNNSLFERHSWYFRNALVRANFEDLSKGIYKTDEFLLKFFENLLLDAGHELKNRDLRIKTKG